LTWKIRVKAAYGEGFRVGFVGEFVLAIGLSDALLRASPRLGAPVSESPTQSSISSSSSEEIIPVAPHLPFKEIINMLYPNPIANPNPNPNLAGEETATGIDVHHLS